MNIALKSIVHFAWGFTINLLVVTASFAATAFYLLPDGNEQRINCDYLEIKNNQVLCTVNSLIFTYDPGRIKSLEIVHEGQSFYVQNLTEDTTRKINQMNSNKINRKKTEKKEKGERAKYAFGTPRVAQQISFDSFPDFIQSLKKLYRHQINSSTLNMILLDSGLVVFFIGSLGYLIATFRAGILWGLSCVLFPFISLIFLFVHWKVAAKPFFVSLLGAAIVFSGTLLAPTGGTAFVKKEVAGRHSCSGKIYCSQMTSCAEAKFYLRNCPGTKIDGNYDGVPCEKQWCD